MKKLFAQTILFMLLCFSFEAFGQSLFRTKTGEVSFYSKAPLEDIAAVNKEADILINTSNNEVVSAMKIKKFDFPNNLMEEHFNENYMESGKFPNAVFKGKINEKIDFTKEGTHNVTATGKISIHGVEKDKTITGTLKVVPGEKLILDATFDIILVDHKIERPSIVTMKIAEKIDVKSRYELLPFKK